MTPFSQISQQLGIPLAEVIATYDAALTKLKPMCEARDMAQILDLIQRMDHPTSYQVSEFQIDNNNDL
jgi:hypothetical protein